MERYALRLPIQEDKTDSSVISAWKQYYASDMYFIPMFDDTADYYTADDSVRILSCSEFIS